ncbi:uncharacterized protein PG998_011347 [Apiospora kogelbergensis]|uniref:uncharacterized protein n=1 Tax=Apiospora kogelbergensis TaxID=1337665 RepID=UPI00312F2A0F
MSGVKNLRAMFEQKTGDSPPDRGRSPPGSASGSVKLVRLNFVAIEKDGRIGLQREPSRESASVSSRRPSNESETTTPAPVSEKGDVFSDNMAHNAVAFRTNLAAEPIPESPKQAVTPPSRWSPKISPKKGTQTPDIVPNSNPDKITDEEETKTKLTAADPTTAAALQPNGDDAKSATNGVAKNGTPSSKTKASPISTTGKTAAKAPKSPAVAHAPKSSVQASLAGSLTPSATGFVKPKVKSPTRPAKLPASLTKDTTASALKNGAQAPVEPAPRKTLSRTSGNHLTVNNGPTQRPHSRNSATAAAAPPKTLKRQNSTINRTRPSIGPPPKPMAKDHPVTKKEAHVDESFLARMMRPTQASASKTTEKAPITPPKKHSVPTAVKKSSAAKDGESHAKRATAKLSESTKAKGSPAAKKPAAAKGPAKAEPSAKEVAPVAAQATSAEVAIEAAAVSKDTAITPVVEKSEPQAVEAVVEAAAAASSDKESQESKETAVKEPETVEEAKLTNGANGAQETSTVPVVSANPQEVKDVEDVVQDAPASKSEESHVLAPAAEITPAKTEEDSVDASETY